MPIYEYKCRHCGDLTSHFEKLPQPPKTVKCLTCGHEAVHIFSLPVYKFVGEWPGESLKKKVDYGEKPIRRGKTIKTI